jgi:mercuric ion transport protein
MTSRHTTDLLGVNRGSVHFGPSVVDNRPPTRSKVMGVLAAVACVACSVLPFLIAAGVLTSAGAVIVESALLGSAGLMLAAGAGMWWLHRRRTVHSAAVGAGTGSHCAAPAGAHPSRS